MKLEVLPDAAAVARRAARWLADAARDAVAARGTFTLALSGGRTPAALLRALAAEQLPWEAVHLFQVDERVAPAGDPARNLSQLRACLLDRVALAPERVHALPVERADLAAAAAAYARDLQTLAGAPPVLDVVHLGLGDDGHTASLVPGDPVLDVVDRDVAVTGEYAGHRRLTLTYPALERARRVLWVVTGSAKAAVLPRLLAGDPAIPAGRLQHARATLLVDAAAAAALAPRA
ncbi:MAG: 6-phosphogluconolactonase [Planctomycetes bacterium]|nr:6-phosphogluconolactonase [Planctomycetota bacterium]